MLSCRKSRVLVMSVSSVLNYGDAESLFESDQVLEDPKELVALLQNKIQELECVLESAKGALFAKEVVDLTHIAKEAIPSVVRIETIVFADTLYSEGSIGNSYPASGSGFIISQDGYIVTNHHIIDGARKINIIFNDQRPGLLATVWGSDPGTDLALLKVEAEDLPFLRFASDEVNIGDTAISIGNPLGFKNLLTLGVIGGKGFSLEDACGKGYFLTDEGFYASYLLSDAQTNPGSSGCPVFNQSGEVIGVHSRGVSGIGIHIDSSTAISVVDELMKKGHVTRPWLGARLNFLDETSIDVLGLEDALEGGLLVTDVLEASPAMIAGLKFGDVIVEYGGVKPNSLNQFFTDLAMKSSPGDELEIKISRKGEIISMCPCLGSHDVNVTTPIERLGIVVEEFDAEKAFLYDLDPSIKGVLISSAKWFSGLRPKEVITGVMTDLGDPIIEIKNVDDLVNAIEQVEEGKTIFLVARAPDQSRAGRYPVIV